MKILGLGIPLLISASAAIVAAQGQPLLIYNPSNSVPAGFYVHVDRGLERGDFVTVMAADVAPAYAALRDYTDPSDRFLKRIAAVGGQRVCAEGGTVSIDGAVTVVRAQYDSVGRSLPSWEGCRMLAAGEVFLLGDTADSFDGRYWGPTSTELIAEVWRPLSD
ncbi:MAG: S26 family signal peptidase [Hyphomonadaceae bacterium]|nr:S26 family signal peptidase [Hyphomonadaceae bacterium]